MCFVIIFGYLFVAGTFGAYLNHLHNRLVDGDRYWRLWDLEGHLMGFLWPITSPMYVGSEIFHAFIKPRLKGK